MGKWEGDIHLIRMKKERCISRQVAPLIYSEDRTICQNSGGYVYLFLNTCPTLKSDFLQETHELVTDLEEILKDEESIFFRDSQGFVRIRNYEEILPYLDCIKSYCLQNHKMTIVQDGEEEFIKEQNFLNNNFKETTLFIDRIIYSLSTEESACVSLKEKVLLSEQSFTCPSHKQQHHLPKYKNHLDHPEGAYCQPSQSERGGDESKYTPAVRGSDRSNQRHETFELDCSFGAKTQAKYPEYKEEVKRKSSFSKWSYGQVQDPKALVENGFFYTGVLDLVRCFQCGLGLKDFSKDDNSLQEHIRYAEHCDFLVELIGSGELTIVKAEVKQSDPSYYRKIQWREIQFGQPDAATLIPSERHPRYSEFNSRLDSFKNWPRTSCKNPTELANAGFFYTGKGDLVKCWDCDGGFQNWDPIDDPWVEHCRWFPACQFANKTKGKKFIRLVQQATESGDERELQAELIKIRVEQKEIEADAGSDRLACWQEGAVGVDENTNRIVAQMAEMGYDENIVRSAVESLTRKGNHQPDIWSVCDEIEGKKNESTREHRTVDSLKRENKMLKDKLICVKCKAASREALFLPCKHLRMCMSCSENLFRCPVCDQNIIQKLKTYMP